MMTRRAIRLTGSLQEARVDLGEAGRGRPGRFTTYPEVKALAKNFTGYRGDMRITAASVVGMILRAAPAFEGDPVAGCPELSGTARMLLAVLTEHIFGAEPWATGELYVYVTMRMLCDYAILKERQVRRCLGELEAHGWLIRRYDARNQRLVLASIDLRPLGARIDELIEAEDLLRRRNAVEREMMRIERVDDEAVAAALEEAQATDSPESSGSEKTSIPVMEGRYKSLLSKSLEKTIVRKEARQGSVARPSEEGKRRSRLADTASNREILALMVEHSVTLRKTLGVDNLDDPSPIAVTRSVQYLLDLHGISKTLRRDAWTAAVEIHGMAAFAAALIAIERPGISKPTAYLARMLLAPDLRHTVVKSLPLMAHAPGKPPRRDN